ncbi:MAG TPA: hypothetical protein PKV98_04130 [Burkholderiaceae bacterium]|nr:hypothetical protein [Burkholderiaceae bacterium]
MADTQTNPFLVLARDAYSEATSYFDSGVRSEIEADIRQFQSQHPSGSKYLDPSYRARSRFFRPKTRGAVRKNEAIGAAALFSNSNVLSLQAEDQTDKMQAAAAFVWQEVMNQRLSTSIPWFQTAIGAYQDAMVTGVCISYQHWLYNKKRRIDMPCISLEPVENIRFSPNANWADPVRTSPYFIRMVPMFLKDVKARAQRGAEDKMGAMPWKQLDDTVLLTAAKSYSDSIRLQRNQGRADQQNQSQVNAFSLVWVHQNFIELNDVDYVYWTLGTHEMLSIPQPVEELYPLGGARPFVVGNCVIETHKVYPAGPVRLGRDVQAELNENANQRSDNVRFAMNKRYFVKRGKQVDLRSLSRNTPGSSTMMDDPSEGGDVRVVDTPDVTRSAYEEQDRLNLDYDDLNGTFSQASVQSNRRVVDSKGGLELLSEDSSKMGTYQLHTWVETWAKPALGQLLLLEQQYETDERIFAVAGKKAQAARVLDQDQQIDDVLLTQRVTVKLNVGIGATTPKERVANFTGAMTSVKEMFADDILTKIGADSKEITDEIMSLLGYDGGDRFFPERGQDPKLADLQAKLDEALAKLAKREDPELTKAKIQKLLAETDKIGSEKVKAIVEAIFGSMQAAEVIAAVPQVAPIADQVMKAGGYQEPVPSGVDPGFAPGEQGPNMAAAGPAPGLTVDTITNKRSGVGFQPPGAPPDAAGGPPGSAAQPANTNPLTPASPASPFVGPNSGIETMRPDTQGADR